MTDLQKHLVEQWMLKAENDLLNVANILIIETAKQMNPVQIAEQIYAELSAKIRRGVIPTALRPSALVGTVQDDPFDS